MKSIGQRINEFDNLTNVEEFNILFKEVPIVGFNDSDEVEIGEITQNHYTRILTIGNKQIEHSFKVTLNSEKEDEIISDLNNVDNDSL